MDERVDAFTEQWYRGKGHVWATGKMKENALDPCHIWEDAEAHGRRHQLVERHEANIKCWEDRLEQEIWEAPHNPADEVRACSKNLETTINRIEDAEWLLSTPQPPRKTKVRTPKPAT